MGRTFGVFDVFHCQLQYLSLTQLQISEDLRGLNYV